MPQLSPMSWTIVLIFSLIFIKTMEFNKSPGMKSSVKSLSTVHKKWSW